MLSYQLLPVSSKVTPENLKLLGGRLCLHFANTVDWADGEPMPDYEALTEPDALARWGRRLGVPGGAPDGRELACAVQLRRALYATFAALDAGEEPPAQARERIARDHAEAAAAAHLAAAGDAWRLDWPADDPRRVRFAVVADAVALLADPDGLVRVHRCPGRNCGWLFYDASGRRRWCSMATCGSREKMRRLYARRHGRAA
jgi:predicted RNA-binding Zn ribbon-like protein